MKAKQFKKNLNNGKTLKIITKMKKINLQKIKFINVQQKINNRQYYNEYVCVIIHIGIGGLKWK